MSGMQLLYTGTLSHALKRLKLLSLASCGAACCSAPILVAMESNIAMGGKMALTSLVLGASLGSTSLIHYFTKPYVHRLYVEKPSPNVEYVFILLGSALTGHVTNW